MHPKGRRNSWKQEEATPRNRTLLKTERRESWKQEEETSVNKTILKTCNCWKFSKVSFLLNVRSQKTKVLAFEIFSKSGREKRKKRTPVNMGIWMIVELTLNEYRADFWECVPNQMTRELSFENVYQIKWVESWVLRLSTKSNDYRAEFWECVPN